ncbi:acetyl-CoA carboxylase biotin carboxyl carrier protein [Microtetraspora fusca]|uniref:acetyl-CoA carboxylase biotin carboxyl carrier protein n=1 Tax=Microtetraspora fusca TaxID=1997 RepID=UPI00082A6259|nr:biotin/lipoyl-containing protein [Microtetraspora fusca]
MKNPSEPGGDLDLLCQAATRLVSLLPQPPATLKLRLGAASAELTWESAPAYGPAAGATPWEAPAAEPADPALDHVTAPLVGTFYHAPEPGAPPFVAVGGAVEAGQQVGIVESMKLMNPVHTEIAGRVVEILVPDATSVEYDQPLIAIAPAGGDEACAVLFPGKGEPSAGHDPVGGGRR